VSIGCWCIESIEGLTVEFLVIIFRAIFDRSKPKRLLVVNNFEFFGFLHNSLHGNGSVFFDWLGSVRDAFWTIYGSQQSNLEKEKKKKEEKKSEIKSQ
jgi:hypothetical protein